MYNFQAKEETYHSGYSAFYGLSICHYYYTVILCQIKFNFPCVVLILNSEFSPLQSQLLPSVDIFCKQFGPRSGKMSDVTWIQTHGSKLFDNLMAFLKHFWICFYLNRILIGEKSMQNYPARKELIPIILAGTRQTFMMTSLTFCMIGIFSCFCLKIIFFKKIF